MVALAFTIRADGTTADISVSQSSGHPELDAAAVECAKTWLYKPAEKDGVAVDTPWSAKIRWALSDKPDVLTPAVTTCVSSKTTQDELETATQMTFLRVRVNKGAITSVEILGSSGNPTLDQRVATCWTDLPSSLTASAAANPDGDTPNATLDRYVPFYWGTLRSTSKETTRTPASEGTSATQHHP
jgi:TonB family protein